MGFAQFTRVYVLSSAVLASACGGGNGPRVPPTGGPDIGALHAPWKDKSHDERQAYMAAHVQPMMRKAFQKFDKKEFADFDCKTCHGDNADSVDFRMPNGLPPLDEKDPVADAMGSDEDTAKFMVDEVLPMMSRLLSKSDEHGNPVTCFTCHPKS